MWREYDKEGADKVAETMGDQKVSRPKGLELFRMTGKMFKATSGLIGIPPPFDTG